MYIPHNCFLLAVYTQASRHLITKLLRGQKGRAELQDLFLVMCACMCVLTAVCVAMELTQDPCVYTKSLSHIPRPTSTSCLPIFNRSGTSLFPIGRLSAQPSQFQASRGGDSVSVVTENIYSSPITSQKTQQTQRALKCLQCLSAAEGRVTLGPPQSSALRLGTVKVSRHMHQEEN